jgi:AcrR family transcriptional regulator
MAKTDETDIEQRSPGRPRDEAAKERILEAAVELLEEFGFAQVTSDAIAQRSGASKATIYRWWPNKVAVLVEAFVHRMTPEVPLREVESLEHWVTLHIREFAGVLTGRNGRLLAAIVAAAQNDPEVQQTFVSHWIAPRRQMWRRALERFQEKGALPADFDINVVLDAMYGPLYFLLMVRHGKVTTAYAEALARTLLSGFLPRAARS